MPPVPPPDVSALRVRLIFGQEGPRSAGNRFYLRYAGSAPTPGNCTTIASDIAAAWSANLAALLWDGDGLAEVDVLDITTETGNSGQWTGDNSGTRSGSFIPDSCCLNVEFNIARRYRGGKPRMYLLAGVDNDLHDQSNWTTGFTGTAQTAVEGFFTAVQSISVGAVGALQHINLSYYKGFTNFTTPSGRERAVPKYRDTALSDVVEGYAVKQIVGSQRRRRTSTTP